MNRGHHEPPRSGAFLSRAGRMLLARSLVAITVLTPGAGGTTPDGPRIEISVAERRLWVIGPAGDTLLTAPVAVGSGKTLTWQGRRWTFETKPGEYRVLNKERDPVWVPPIWHYAEIARARGLEVVEFHRDATPALSGGRTLLVRRDTVGVVGPDSAFRPLPPGREIVFDGVLYVPPFGTVNRRVAGPLGKYRLNLGGGFGLHGTLEKESIPRAVTHGCIRLHDADIEWLYRNVPVGSRVTVY